MPGQIDPEEFGTLPNGGPGPTGLALVVVGLVLVLFPHVPFRIVSSFTDDADVEAARQAYRWTGVLLVFVGLFL